MAAGRNQWLAGAEPTSTSELLRSLLWFSHVDGGPDSSSSFAYNVTGPCADQIESRYLALRKRHYIDNSSIDAKA